jgi:hypothetical protein
LIIYDKGYLCFELVHSHNKIDVDFLFRVKVSFNNLVKDFVSSGKKNQVIELMPGKNECYKDKAYSNKQRH